MAVFRVIETDLLSLASESRRALPAVKDAAERAVFELRRYAGADVIASLPAPALAALRAQVLAPLLIACNHADAPKKVLALSLGAIQRLVTADCITPSDMPGIAHVLEIQVRARRSCRSGSQRVRVRTHLTLPHPSNFRPKMQRRIFGCASCRRCRYSSRRRHS